jgi:hypothetical protein
MKLGNKDYLQRDYQVIAEKCDYDNFGDKISIRKSRRVSISYKLNKRGKKMIDIKNDMKTIETLTNINAKVGMKLYMFIRQNPNREGLLVKKGTTEPVSIQYLVKYLEADRARLSKCINALIRVDVLKKHKRLIYINPDIYVPLVNDFELRCILDRYNDGFVKPLDEYREELSKLLELAKLSAKRELDFDTDVVDKLLVNTVNLDVHRQRKNND